jgi:hypothetical protein
MGRVRWHNKEKTPVTGPAVIGAVSYVTRGVRAEQAIWGGIGVAPTFLDLFREKSILSPMAVGAHAREPGALLRGAGLRVTASWVDVPKIPLAQPRSAAGDVAGAVSIPIGYDALRGTCRNRLAGRPNPANSPITTRR